jgi:hypothetical protein
MSSPAIGRLDIVLHHHVRNTLLFSNVDRLQLHHYASGSFFNAYNLITI